MKLNKLVAMLCLVGGPLNAEEKGPFAININRPAKVGDKFTLKTIAQISTTQSIKKGGNSAGANLQQQGVLIEGEIEIQAVTPKESQPWKYRVQITKCVAGEKPDAATLLPAGSVVTVELTPAKAPLLKVGEKVPAEPLLSLLSAALPAPATEDARPEDKLFGSADKKSPDDEWKPEPAVVAAAFKKKGVTAETTAIETRARLTEVTDWDDIPSILVKGNVTIKPCTIPVPGSQSGAPGKVTFVSEYYLPLDATLPVAREKTETRFTAETAGSEKLVWVTRMLKKK